MRDGVQTTSGKGLNTDSLPYRLYQKAKRFGIWNPQDIDFTQDKEDWQKLTPAQQQELKHRLASFQAGEESVTIDILPLILLVAKQGRLEEEMFLTTFLFEEAKHTEFFRLALNELGITEDLSRFHTPSYRRLFFEELPAAMNRLLHDDSPEAVAEASCLYNMFIEGVLAETGYWNFYEGLSRNGLMPGLMKGIGYLKTDESRHIAYGTFLLQRLICEHPHIYDLVARRLQELADLSLQIPLESSGGQGLSTFGVPAEESQAFSRKQLTVRLEVLARAKHQTLEEIYKTSEAVLGVL